MLTLSDIASSLRMMAAILLIAAITGVGSWFLYNQYVIVEQQSVAIQTRVYRDAMGVLRDLRRLTYAMESSRTGALTPGEVLNDISEAFDYLYVRRNSMGETIKGDESLTRESAQVEALLDALIATGDVFLSQDSPEVETLIEDTSELLDTVHGELMAYVDGQFFRQRAAVVAQIDALRVMVFVAIGLLWIFGLISAVVVFLYQAELRELKRRRLAESKASFLAYFDSMTGLQNRTGFRDAAGKMLKKHRETAFFLFDIDDFKQANDIYGHSAGDAVLSHVAANIRVVVEEMNGVCARLGGDEFAAILPGPISSMRAAAMCERIIAGVTTPFSYENNQLSAKISIGMAFSSSLDLGEGKPFAQLQKAADIALYRAKEDGKNTYAFYDAELAAFVAKRQEMELGIDQALKNDEFVLAYQPQVEMDTGEIKGFEALARWTRDGVPVSPGEFIPVAESTGQVVEIDLWGLHKATMQTAAWIRDGLMPVTISTNLSPLHFRSDRIVDEVRTALKNSGLPPHLLTLEITESVLIDDVVLVTATLERLRKLGVRIALDDFGTGYSSLAYLRKLDVDFIKIDQSFVRNLEDSAETQLILRALVDIAIGLRKLLVVEGIETEAQSALIKRLGCQYGQGYLFGRPLPLDEAQDMIPRLRDVAPAAAAG